MSSRTQSDSTSIPPTGSHGAPLPTLQLADPDFWRDVHTPLAEARRQGAMAVTSEGAPIVLRRHELDLVLRDPVRFPVADKNKVYGGMSGGPIAHHWHHIMGNMNPPEHTRLRSLVSKAFTPRRVNSLRPAVSEWTVSAIERSDDRVLDAWADLADIPVKVIARMLGIPAEDESFLAGLAASFAGFFSMSFGTDLDRQREVGDAITELSTYSESVIAQRRQRPGDDLISDLVTAHDREDRLTQDELVALIGNLLWAGVHTTRSAIPTALTVLSSHPDQARWLAQHPDKINTAVEEILRFEPTTLFGTRLVAQDLELGGMSLSAGQSLLLCTVAAERDETVHQQADVLNLRKDQVVALNFGAGIHHCLGAAVARLELQEIILGLLSAGNGVELVSSPAWVPFSVIREVHPVRIALVP